MAGYGDDTLMLTSVALLFIVLALIFWVLSKPVTKIVSHLVSKTNTLLDDYLLSKQNVRIACLLVTTILLCRWLPPCIIHHPDAVTTCSTLLQIAITLLVTRLLVLLIKSTYKFFEDNESASQTARSLRGIGQLFQTIIVCIAIIIIISILIHRSPLFILSGLGASAAVLMLVFKETILGFMASIRLNSNNMLQVGDWITMPSRNINGVVKEICLTTVKVENYDMTIVTVPPHALVSESFQNWRGIYDKGARRIMRSINIDITSVRYLTPTELASLLPLLPANAPAATPASTVPAAINEKPASANASSINGEEQPINSAQIANSAEQPLAEAPCVNLSLFRRYLKQYLESEQTFRASDDDKMYCMVRELEPTATGLPLQIYLFTSETSWPNYEDVQAALIDHILAITPRFGLRLFQSPSGHDLAR
jgi:miniconductance mechanosensitive channel